MSCCWTAIHWFFFTISGLRSICINIEIWNKFIKKGQRKVQGVPQSQTAALPRSQEEEETDKSKQAQTEQTYEKH